MFSMYYYGWINGWMIEWLHGDGWMDVMGYYAVQIVSNLPLTR